MATFIYIDYMQQDKVVYVGFTTLNELGQQIYTSHKKYHEAYPVYGPNNIVTIYSSQGLTRSQPAKKVLITSLNNCIIELK